MSFQIGDKVIHFTHGLGEIDNIEERVVCDHLANCYVVRTSNMMIWIPIDDVQQHSLRTPTVPQEFKRLFDILTGPGEELPSDRIQRKERLLTQMRDGQLESICRVVRDLNHYKRSTKLNDQEKSILERATNSLLTEWSYSLGVSLDQARHDLTAMLGE